MEVRLSDAIARGPVQVIPQGLLGLLQLKQTGASPGHLSDVIDPIIELRDWLMFSRELSEVGLGFGGAIVSVATASPGFKAFVPNIVVPNGQAWYVTRFCVDGALLAAESIRLVPAFTEPGTGSVFSLGADYNDVITARARQFAVTYGTPFWLRPGDNLGVWVFDDVTAASIAILGHVRACVLPI